ncbi:MAG: hypothetical protein HY329_07710 [Chloroflexi bacterium]|nr:hypothetical protein [Chloroflexota bacterium]
MKILHSFGAAVGPLEERTERAQALGLLDPTDTAKPSPKAAARLRSLAGVRVALLDNKKPNAALLLRRIGERLVAEHGVAETALFSKFIYSKPAAPDVVERLAAYDAVVTAIGD